MAKVSKLKQRKEKKEERKANLIDALKLISPGTILRTAIDDILRAGMGALIVVDTPKLENILEGGFGVNSDLTSQRIVELAKMDGAIVLSEDFKKILYANTLLVPDTRIPSNETGTRHKAAERTAQQVNTLVIAVSERRKKISLYYGIIRYILQNTEEVLTRATENLQILEKQRDIFDDLISNLNVLEISGLVVISDVCSVLQRISMIEKLSAMMEKYLIELGREGVIIRMRLRELLKNVNKEKELLLRDYEIAEEKISTMNELGFDELLDSESISEILFSCSSESKIIPKGYRILNKTDLSKEDIEKLVSKLKTLDSVLSLNVEETRDIFEEKTEFFQRNIASLREQIMVGKKI